MVIDVSSIVFVTKVCNVPTNEFIEPKLIYTKKAGKKKFLLNKISPFCANIF